MKWHEVKEQAAGEKRLLLLWYIYKILGKNIVKFIVFFVTFFALLGAKKIKESSKKYLKIIGQKDSFFNVYKHCLSYSFALVDRMEIFSDNFSPNKIEFANEESRAQLFDDLAKEKGMFFICNHIGNIDVMRALMLSNAKNNCKGVCVFLAKEQCKIFNSFIAKITTEQPILLYPVEDIDINTSIEIKEKLDNNFVVFMAGDRTSKNSINFETDFLNHKVDFPLGTFKFAQMMEVPTYFISALKEKNDKYKLHLKKFYPEETKKETLEKMKKEFVMFTEKMVELAPFQFYHFYDMFKD
ncbi:hypothetical protein IJD15_02500 [bacterium]|nr:hypothetical protein [bacterium]